ncbi:fibrinogen silencer-binding protein-like isoform X2 [Drosophila montana]|uniref:fibrinogen silencer-binding protein-like isoform X2 n=1 Tax=Drosophila montana TaxID=40370 RepID=UPI00313DAF2F
MNSSSRRQRSRMPNFTIAEENILRMLTAKYHKEIEDKASNAHVWRAKNRAWESIAAEFYNNTQIQRSAVKLKSKYETMKKQNKLLNVLVKREPTQEDASPNERRNTLDESKKNVDQAEQVVVVEQLKAETQADHVMSEVDPGPIAAEPGPSEADQTMSDAEQATPDADQIMSEDKPMDGIETVLSELRPDFSKISVRSRRSDSNISANIDVKQMREFLRQYKNLNQAQLAATKSNAPSPDTEKPALHSSEEDNAEMLKELSLSQRSLAAQFNYYRNMDIRAQQKHLAELKNLEIQHQILELELQIKQKELQKNS